MTYRLVSRTLCALAGWMLWFGPSEAGAQLGSLGGEGLQEQLEREDFAELAGAARQNGDPVRGAILFYQPYMTCTQCHNEQAVGQRLGPDLTELGKLPTGEQVIESILKPSKQIRKGFETVVVMTEDGVTTTGILVEDREDALVMRDMKQEGRKVTIDRQLIEQMRHSDLSTMPAGLVNQLTSRQQFLDLASYVLEIIEKGPGRALELKPAPSLYAARPLPEYEKNIDHAGMIADLNHKSFQRGEAIYNRLCANCHGTHDREGSLPTSLKFASDKFKNGSDPYRMYQTLTKGYGLMVAQTWMVPQQKYDVIHYIREAYLKKSNPSQFVQLGSDYLARLPKGTTRGPAPTVVQPWVNMDYGPSLMSSYEIGSDAENFAYKGIAVRLDSGPGGVSRGQHWMLFDHDTLRWASGWSGKGFIDWKGIAFDGQHAIHPRVTGQVHFQNRTGPGWASPEQGHFEDRRLQGRDGRRYGPLPRRWAQYKGMYHHENRVIVSYTVGATEILEMPSLEAATPIAVFARTLSVGARKQDLVLRAADAVHPEAQLTTDRQDNDHLIAIVQPPRSANPQDSVLVAGVTPVPQGATWMLGDEGGLRLKIPAGTQPINLKLWLARPTDLSQLEVIRDQIMSAKPRVMRLAELTRGGPKRWPEVLKTEAVIGNDDGPFAVDVLTRPASNPWLCRVRLTGFDYYPDGRRLAVCTWDGDVWLVRGIDQPEKGLTWQRIASGLFQPLGLKIVDDKIYLGCRDQLCILHDLNGDGETDFYQSFNNDHQVTEHFHEFAMGLQTDAEGNFYYAKSARHAKKALVPHHGTLLKVSKDGQRTEILATGFRAANGVCVNPDGSFIVTDQEGHWNPKNRINWVKPGGFYGNMWGYHDVEDESDHAMQPPLCWITNRFDRSPAELLWVDSPVWGPLNGSLLNLSYGHGQVYVVPHENVQGQVQGGMCPLPIKSFPTGVMRGRFHPKNGQLYLCGMFAWAGNQQQPGGFYRIRYTGKPVHLPIGLRATTTGLSISFSGALDPDQAKAVKNYAIKTWALKRTARYGSDHYDTQSLKVTNVELSEDRKTVFLEIEKIQPTWCMEIRYRLRGAGGERVDGTVHNTIHRLSRSP